MTVPEQAVWRTSSLSANGADCVQVAVINASGTSGHEAENPLFLVRDSKNVDGGVLTFTPGAWRAFVGGIKSGDLDTLT
ncbi:DUF397 domain-containing protein [Streptosporangium sp. NPDC004631]